MKFLSFDRQSKVLIIQTAFLGDVVLATSLVNSIKTQYPESRIDILVKKGNEGILEGHPQISRVLVLNKSQKWRSLYQMIGEVRKSNYDFVINVHRFFSSGLIAVTSRAKSVGFNKNPLSRFYSLSVPHPILAGIHETDRNFALISSLGIAKKERPKLVPTRSARERISSLQKEPYVCFAPASVWKTKQLPMEKWIQLANQNSHTVYLLGAPNDKELCENIRRQSNGTVINLAGELTLLESVALMEGAQRNYVNDSGPLHFASAVNAPTTAFFCSTVTEFGFGPLSEDSEVKEVPKLPCRPCGLHGKQECPEGHFKCGKEMVV